PLNSRRANGALAGLWAYQTREQRESTRLQAPRRGIGIQPVANSRCRGSSDTNSLQASTSRWNNGVSIVNGADFTPASPNRSVTPTRSRPIRSRKRSPFQSRVLGDLSDG